MFQNWIKIEQPEFEEKNIVAKIARVRESFQSSEVKDLISSSSFAEPHHCIRNLATKNLVQ